jgi:hypothetical protein
MTDQQLVKQAEIEARKLTNLLRQLYVQSSSEDVDNERKEQLAKIYVSGLMRGVWDIIDYFKVGE